LYGREGDGERREALREEGTGEKSGEMMMSFISHL
jgi:hypothetical protein